MQAAVARVAERWQGSPLLVLALGEDAPPERIGRAEIRFVPFQSSPEAVARYYQAADVYLHAARADTFPTTVLEALGQAGLADVGRYVELGIFSEYTGTK